MILKLGLTPMKPPVESETDSLKQQLSDMARQNSEQQQTIQQLMQQLQSLTSQIQVLTAQNFAGGAQTAATNPHGTDPNSVSSKHGFHQRVEHEPFVWNFVSLCIYLFVRIDCCCGGAVNADVQQHMATVDFSSECNLPAFVNPPVSNPSEFVHSKHPSTWDEAFLSTATALSSSPEQVRLQIASWNANSLNPHIYEAQALGMDILAIQEARISQDVVPGIRASLSKNGYRLFHGTLPSFKLQGHNRKTLHIDQTIPGVAFIVKQHIPVQEVVFEDMQHWESRGRFSALKVFINNKWVLLFNAYAPTQNSTPFLNDITHFLSKHAHTDCVFFADINACSREGEFVQEMCSLGWFPLTISTPSSFFTFKHSSGSTSCIDTIMVTDKLKEEVSPIQQKPVLKKGHVAITCSIHQHDTQKPSWLIFHKVCYEDPGDEKRAMA